jgi:non-specific protein-tyrosine kinase
MLARTYSKMLEQRSVLRKVIDRLELDATPEGLTKKVEVDLVPETQLIQVSVKDNSAIQAALLANTIAEVFIAQLQEMQQERYADSLSTMQEQISELSVLIEDAQSKIDVLRAQEEAGSQVEATRLETGLLGYRNTLATLQQDYHQMRLAAARSVRDVVITETAEVPKKPEANHRMLFTALAGVVGTMLAVGVAFLSEYLDDTIKTAEDISRALGVTTLGTIGLMSRGDGEVAMVSRPFSAAAEAFRVLRTNIRFSSVDRPLHTLLVTSANASEGKSTVLANLAVASAQAGLRVVAVDGDLRRPRQHQVFGLDAGLEGLTETLLEGGLNGRLCPIAVEGLSILPSGELPPNPTEMLASHRMAELLRDLSEQADVVMIDGPPLMPVADAAALARMVDGVVLVIHSGKTRRGAARLAVESLRQVEANLIGAVLNAVPTRMDSRYYRYYKEAETRRELRLGRWEVRLPDVRRFLGRWRKAKGR